MALVPAANGVESIAAAEGIRIVDTGGNRFTIGLNVVQELSNQGDIFDAILPPGLTQFNFGAPIELNYAGPYLVTVALSLGSAAGEITAGPDDRIVFGIQNPAGAKLISVPMKVYNRAAADPVSQLTSLSVVIGVDTDTLYQPVVQAYNVSGGLDAPNGLIAFNMAPLTSLQPNEPAGPGLRGARRLTSPIF